jgi:hypothetical protein
MWVFWRVEASRENLLFFFRNPFSWDAKLHKLPMHFPYMRKESRKPRWARRSCIQHICASASWAYVFFANHPYCHKCYSTMSSVWLFIIPAGIHA